MARYSGVIGYGEKVETAPGVWEDVITEVSYRGDVVRDILRNEKGEQLNDNLVLNNSISIVADERAFSSLPKIKYIQYQGDLWTVSSVEIKPPRLILSLGKVYNGPTP